ncbi:MAG: hypothetical protein V4534_07310 [Myxococcota bacterium]
MRAALLIFIYSTLCAGSAAPLREQANALGDRIDAIQDFLQKQRTLKTDDLFAIAQSFLRAFPISTEGAEPKTAGAYAKARALFLSGKFEQSQAILLNLPKAERYEFQRVYLLAAIKVHQGQLDAASKLFASMAYLTPRDRSDIEVQRLALKATGMIAEEQHQDELALRIYEKLGDCEYEQARIYLAQNNFRAAMALLTKLQTRLAERPETWINDQESMRSLFHIQNRLITDQEGLAMARNHYNDLGAELSGWFGLLQERLDELAKPQLEIPIVCHPGTDDCLVTIALDEKVLLDRQAVSPNMMATLPVDFGTHQFSINQQAYWLTVSLSKDFQADFVFMDTKHERPQTDLTYVSKLHEMIGLSQATSQQLSGDQNTTFNELKLGLEALSAKVAHAQKLEASSLRPELARYLKQIDGEILLITSQANIFQSETSVQREATIIKEKNVKLKMPD